MEGKKPCLRLIKPAEKREALREKLETNKTKELMSGLIRSDFEALDSLSNTHLLTKIHYIVPALQVNRKLSLNMISHNSQGVCKQTLN
jgi:hypothetical protein